MANCKNCLSYEVCAKRKMYDNLRSKTGASTSSDLDCECFKDKSNFIELPCEVGDTVWYVNNPTDDFEGDYEGWTFLGCNEKYAFVGCGINGSFDVDDICDNAYEKFLEYSGEIYCVPLDKLYFSKEEAEQALEAGSVDDEEE